MTINDEQADELFRGDLGAAADGWRAPYVKPIRAGSAWRLRLPGGLRPALPTAFAAALALCFLVGAAAAGWSLASGRGPLASMLAAGRGHGYGTTAGPSPSAPVCASTVEPCSTRQPSPCTVTTPGPNTACVPPCAYSSRGCTLCVTGGGDYAFRATACPSPCSVPARADQPYSCPSPPCAGTCPTPKPCTSTSPCPTPCPTTSTGASRCPSPLPCDPRAANPRPCPSPCTSTRPCPASPPACATSTSCPTTSPSPSGACASGDLDLTLATDAASYAQGATVSFTATLHNHSSRSCTVPVSHNGAWGGCGSGYSAYVTSDADSNKTVWYARDPSSPSPCIAEQPATLAPGASISDHFSWNQQGRCYGSTCPPCPSAGCTTQQVPSGSYTVRYAWGSTAMRQFTIS